MKRKGILCFVKQEDKILLIQVNYGDGKLIWNGVSGFVEFGEEIIKAVIREVKEEIGVDVNVSSLMHKGTQTVSDALDLEVFVATKWTGEPKPKEESIVGIGWFRIDNIPYGQMFPGNQDWLPTLLK